MKFGADSAWIFHITHIDNLPVVLSEGGLLSENEIRRRNINFRRIGHALLKDRRAAQQIPIQPEYTLADYVPFYFAPKSPMLFSIHSNNVEGYTEGQKPIIYMVGKARDAAESHLDFVFTDGHAVMRLSQYYSSLEDLCRIDWEVMNSRFWSNTDDDSDRMRRRNAEFLVLNSFPIDCVRFVVAFDDEMKNRVAMLLEEAGHSSSIKVLSRRDCKSNFYF